MGTDSQAMNRYVVISKADQTGYVILDKQLFGYCTLPDDSDSDSPNLLPLEWGMREGAEAWLNQCYRAWQAERVPPPEGWMPFRLEESPWARR